MTVHRLHHSEAFEIALDLLIDAGRMTLLRAQSLEDALADLKKNPLNHDGTLGGDALAPHWIKICRATGGVDTGLRVVYLLHEDGSVYLDDLSLVDPR